MSSVTLQNITKAFDGSVVLSDINDTFEDGTFVTLLGPSGCGKTTLLRIIAGFEKPTEGSVWIDDQLVSSSKTFLPPEKRNIGMVFQSYAVWPHMTVFENTAYPLKIKKVSKSEICAKVERVFDIMHLTQYKDRYPNQLSGGQQQRVALARALVAEPKLLLLDEPLSNLDAKLRESMRFEIKDIQIQLGITVVYVTHDQSEAMAMSDKVIVIKQGLVQQMGNPEEIYRSPANPFVADFVGKIEFVNAVTGNGTIHLPGGAVSLPYQGELRHNVIVAIRPEAMSFTEETVGHMSGILTSTGFLGDTYDCRVTLDTGEMVRVKVDAVGSRLPDIGKRVGLRVMSLIVFPENSVEGDLVIRT